MPQAAKKRQSNYWERILGADIRNAGLEGWESEYKFHPKRQWRIDWAHPKLKIGVEIEGGIWVDGRHNRASGFVKDLEKYEEAMRRGWTIYRCSPQMVKHGRAIETIKILVKLRG